MSGSVGTHSSGSIYDRRVHYRFWIGLIRMSATAFFAAILSLAGTTPASAATPLTVTIDNHSALGTLPDDAAFCKPDPLARVAPAANRSPRVHWSAGPAGTQAYALQMVDKDVPADIAMLNRPGLTIPVDATRVAFSHWVLVDIPATTLALPSGADGEGHIKGGKALGSTAYGVRGQNGYAGFFKGGSYGGYDGPCPPWNDARLHHYVISVYAIDVPSLGLSGSFRQPEVEKAMHGHVLASGEAAATYTLNPQLMR